MVGKPSHSCVFCRIAHGELSPGVVAHRHSMAAVFPSLHQQPRNRGHMLVIPRRHVAHLYDVDADMAGPLMSTLARVAAAGKEAFDADGVSVRQNNEPHGGQDIFHVHFHVVPRFNGDGFASGPDHFPSGAVEVPIEEPELQAARLAAVLGNTKAVEPLADPAVSPGPPGGDRDDLQ